MAVDRKLHSLHMLMEGNAFSGRLEVDQRTFECKFKPANALIENGGLVITGSLTFTGRDRRLRRQDNVRATLAAIQGAINGRVVAPVEFATRSGPPEPRPAGPTTEYTNAQGFAGAMYLHLSDLKAPLLGIPLDLERVQLNCRLSPDDDLERELHWLYSGLATSLLGEPKDEARARELLPPLVQRFRA